MKRTWNVVTIVLAGFALLVMGFAGQAAAQAKAGKINGVMSWHFKTSALQETGENRSYWTGTSWGVYQAGNGQGPMHGASVVCNSAWDLNGPTNSGSGHCLVTDAAGDKAFYQWKGGTAENAEWTSGDGEFIGGTGKFKGITGKVNWKHKIVVARNGFSEGEGFSVWDGEYRLP